MKLNFFDKFILKFTICLFIFFVLFLLSKVNLINYKTLKNNLHENINILNIASKLNIYTPLQYDEVANTNDIEISKDDVGYKVVTKNQNYLSPICDGVIIYKDKNTIKIQTKDNYIFEYHNINSDNHIYQYLTKKDILSLDSSCTLIVYKDGEVIDYFNTQKD